MKKNIIIVMLTLLLAGCNAAEKPLSPGTFTRNPKANAELYKEIKKDLQIEDLFADINGIDLQCVDLSQFDLRDYKEELFLASFNSETVWPEDSQLPDSFKPEELMASAFKPSLGIDSIHQLGIKGQNIGVAILDHILLCDHVEYKDNLKMYYEVNLNNLPDSYYISHYHGSAVTSIAAGQNVGVAPEADIYYIYDYSTSGRTEEVKSAELLAENIMRIIEVNEQLPADNKIRVISYSSGIPDDNEVLNEAILKARENKIEFIYSGLFDDVFSGLRKLPYKDGDDIESFVPVTTELQRYQNNHQRLAYIDKIAVPFQGITTAGASNTDDYVYYGAGGVSWAAPYLAGLYALCCEVKTDMTLDEFINIADATSVPYDFTYEGIEFHYSKVIQPEKMIESIINMVAVNEHE